MATMDPPLSPQDNAANEQYINDEIVAICNSLGKTDDTDGTYMKDRDCKPCLKEIIRYLNADSKDHKARTTLGSLNIVKTDLIPLMNQYCDYNDGDPDLFSLVLRLCSNLTSSALMLFENQKIPTEPELALSYRKLLKHLNCYKDAFGNDDEVWKILNTYLRHTEDETVFERVIILIRNILHVPVDSSEDLGIHADFDSHEMCLYQMDRSGMLSTLIYIASETQKGTEFCFHIMEIVYLMLRDKNPATIVAARLQQNKRKFDDDDPDKKRLNELRERDRREREASKRGRSITGARFRNSAFLVENVRSLSESSLIVRTPLNWREEIKFDRGKTELRKAKNKKPLQSETSSITLCDRNTKPTKVTFSLKVFCKKFVEKVYSNFMQHIKHNLIQKRAAENDETYYLWAVQFFSAFNRQVGLTLDNISETLSTSTLHFIHILITNYQEKLQLEKNKELQETTSKRLHLALRVYREMLYLIESVKDDSSLWDSVQSIRKNIFSQVEYSSILSTLFQHYDESKHSPEYLKDLITSNHVFLELMPTSVPSYSTPDVLKAYLVVLKQFRTNEDEVNLAILKFYERIVFDCHNEVMLLQVSVLRCLLDIMNYHSSLPGYGKFVELGKHLMKHFGSMASKKRWMYQELLFWKTTNDVIEIENAVDPPPAPSSPVHPSSPSNDIADVLRDVLNSPKGSQAESKSSDELSELVDLLPDGDDEEPLELPSPGRESPARSSASSIELPSPSPTNSPAAVESRDCVKSPPLELGSPARSSSSSVGLAAHNKSQSSEPASPASSFEFGSPGPPSDSESEKDDN